MYEFIEYVLSELRNSFVLVILAGVVALAVLAAAYFIHKRKYGGGQKFPWGRALLYLMLVGYLAVVFYATIPRGSGGFRQVNLHLFRAWREAWNNFSAKNWANVLLNVAMFVPLGFLLPILWKIFRKWYVMAPAGFAVSLGIELFQLATGRGICDVDDLLANTLGALIGYFLIMTVLSVPGEKGKRIKPSSVYCGLLLASVMAISSIFVVYDAREYGNLPNAAAYTVQTGGVTWSLDCELPTLDANQAVYQTQIRSIEDCDAFAAEFAETAGTTFEDISYYQEAAYYMNHGSENGYHFLFVHYLDTGYEYTWGNYKDPVWVDADRETVEAALERYPLLIPDYADFAVEGDGWHSFTVNKYVDGGVMVDGSLRCRYAQDGTVQEIHNHLLSYTYYDDAEVISPEEAYNRLCAGKFYDGGYFEHSAPETVSVTSCALEYEIDTKGFYQPVYYFEVASGDGTYQEQIMIPAMK